MNIYDRIRRNNKQKQHLSVKYILLILTLICTGTIYFSLTLSLSGGPLSAAAGFIFVPMQEGINTAGSFFSNLFTDLATIKEAQQKNRELEEKIQDLETQIDALKMEQYDEEEYNQLIQLDKTYSDYDKLSACVIAMDSSPWFTTFTINKGTSDGVEAGMNVLAGSGLAGIVTDTGVNYATVRTIVDDTSNVSAMVATTKDNIIVSGNLETMSEDMTLPFTGLSDEDDEVQVGDPVVTSYISDRYHEGILIGYITSIGMESNNLTKCGTISPVVDFEHIQNVLVITREKETGDTETEADDGAQ